LFDPAKTQKTENSNLHGSEVHRPWSLGKGTKLLFQVINAIINQLLPESNNFKKHPIVAL